jgi:hypothetical protein
MLSSRAPAIETYAFVYPSLAMDLPTEYAGLKLSDIELIQNAGVQDADDFTLLSPLNLCLTTGIEPEQIVALYLWSSKMISMVHREQKGLIAELEGLHMHIVSD